MIKGDLINLIFGIDRGESGILDLTGRDFHYDLEKNRRKFLPILREWLVPYSPSPEFMAIEKELEILRLKYAPQGYKPNPGIVTPVDPKKQADFDKEYQTLRDSHQELFEEQDLKNTAYQEFLTEETPEKLILIPKRRIPLEINGHQIRFLYPLILDDDPKLRRMK